MINCCPNRPRGGRRDGGGPRPRAHRHRASGPEWDLGYTGEEGAQAYNVAAERLGLRELDENLLKALEAPRMLQLVACVAQTPDLPVLAEGLKPMLEAWRATPFAGDVV